MDQEILDKIKQNLEERKDVLSKKLAKISDKDGDAVYEDIEDDEDVNAQEVTQYTDRLALVSELQKNIDDVEKSLKKIADGEYGICKYCQKEINPKRLLVRPASGACIECKSTLQGE